MSRHSPVAMALAAAFLEPDTPSDPLTDPRGFSRCKLCPWALISPQRDAAHATQAAEAFCRHLETDHPHEYATLAAAARTDERSPE